MARQHANNAKRLAEAAVSTGDVIVKVKQSVWPAIAMFFSGIGLSVSVPTLATQESGATLSILGDRHAGAPQSVIAKLESNDEEPVRYRWSLTQNGVSKGSMISNSSTIEFPLENSGDFGIAVISSTLSNNVAIRGIAAQFRLEDNLPRADFTYTTEEEYAPASIWADALFDSSQAASCTWVINNEEQDCELSDAPQNLILNKPGLNNVMLKITGHNGAVNLSAAQEIHVKNPSPEVNISDCKFELNNDDFMTAECLGSANPVFPESTIQKTEWLVDGQKTLENIDDFKYTWASPKISELTLRATDNLGHVGEQKVLLYIINPGAYAEY